MARLRDSWRSSLPVAQQPRNPQPESIARNPYHTGRGWVITTVVCSVRGSLESVKWDGSDIVKHNAQSAENSSSCDVIAPGAMERDTRLLLHGTSPSLL